MKSTAQRKPAPELMKITCRACGEDRPVDDYRLYQTKPTTLFMDFCVHCEKQHGTLALYRRYVAYGTREIVDAVYAAGRAVLVNRTPEQVRLLVEPSKAKEVETNQQVLEREMKRRELARRRLIFYVKAMMPDYVPGWVHQDICRRLEKFVRDIELGKSPRLIIAMPPRHGKQLAHTTQVPTPSGMRNHGDLRPGDYVYHPSGVPIRVTAVSDESMNDCEVRFFDGTTVRCHENHEWTVYDRSRAQWRTVETRYLESQVLTSGAKSRARFQLPLYAAVTGTPTDLPIDPYFLGAWLGDGRSANPVICGCEEDMTHIVSLVQYPRGARYVHRVTGVVYQTFVGGIRKQLREAGLLNNKHIPETYLLSSVEQRRRLLEGLVDTDGSVDLGTGRVRFRSSSERLSQDVAALVRSLGYRASLDYTPPDTRIRHVVGGASWCVQWTPHDGHGAGTLPRKRMPRVRDRRRVGIAAVRRVQPELGRCIQVDAVDGLYVVTSNYVTTHNSQLASDLFLSWVLGLHPEWGIIGSSYAQSLPLEFSRNIRDRLEDDEHKAIFPNTRLRQDAKGIEAWKTTKKGGYIAAGVGTGINGKGMHLGVLDDAIKDSEEAQSELIRNNTYAWYKSVFRTRLAPGGGILMIGTRWHYDDVIGREIAKDEELAKAGVPAEERENWDIISYPAVAESDEFLMRDGRILQGIYDDENEDMLRLLRRKGDALHPERWALRELQKLKNGMATGLWTALYQQHPTPDDGDFFKKDDLQYRWLDPAYRPLCRVFMTVDYAIGKKQRNDFTVAAVFALDANDDLYVLEIRRGRWGTLQIAENVLALVERHKPELYAGEQGSIHHAVWPIVVKALDEKRLYVSVDESLVPIQDKEVRARPLQGRTQRHKLFFSYDEQTRPDIYDITEREMLQFPNGRNDDIVDALAWGGRLALNISLPTMKAPPKRSSWKDRLNAHANAGDYSHMAT